MEAFSGAATPGTLKSVTIDGWAIRGTLAIAITSTNGADTSTVYYEIVNY